MADVWFGAFEGEDLSGVDRVEVLCGLSADPLRHSSTNLFHVALLSTCFRCPSDLPSKFCANSWPKGLHQRHCRAAIAVICSARIRVKQGFGKWQMQPDRVAI